jgi:hypothetical protein
MSSNTRNSFGLLGRLFSTGSITPAGRWVVVCSISNRSGDKRQRRTVMNPIYKAGMRSSTVWRIAF